MKRIYAADLMKSTLIILVIFAHRIFYNWSGYRHPAEGNVPLWLLVFGFFAAMGSIFVYITGLVTSFAVYNRISQRRNTPLQIILASLVTFLCLALVNYFILYFFMGSFYINGEFHYATLVGLIKLGKLQLPGLEIICLYSGILINIGISGFAVTTATSLLFRKNGVQFIRRNLSSILSIGIGILILSTFLPFILEPTMYEAFDQGGYVLAALLATLVAFDFPVFPLLGFAFIGAALGLSLATDADQKRLTVNWTFFAIGIIIVGLVLAAIFLLQGELVLNFARYVHLGIFVIITLFLLHYVDFQSQERKEDIIKKYTPLRRFGRVTLTIFVLETPLATIQHLILSTVSPGWDFNLAWVLIFAFLNVILWWIILRYWERVNYIGSLEWGIAKIIQMLSGKSSDKIKLTARAPEKPA